MRSTSAWLLFAASVFLSALLLFLVQPLIAKYLLPWFGGSPTVWTVCLLFFQSLLFVGYAYAHGTTRLLSLRAQAAVHAAFLLASLALLPITPSASWKPVGGEDPTWRLVTLLSRSIGAPYLLLSATGPLLQAWYARVEPRRSPYGLYVLSNLGSLLALLTYPFLLDGVLGAAQQTKLWSWMYAVLAAAVCGTARLAFRAGGRGERSAMAGAGETPGSPGRWPTAAMWFACAMVPSVMLLAVTNELCLDVAPVPFLWILPLAIYLLSLVLCFHSLRWCWRAPWAAAWAAVLPLAIYLLFATRYVSDNVSITKQIAVHSALLLAACMLCHGELVRLKPHPGRLTAFYLTVAAGGACGGIFVGLVAPRIFLTYLEFPLAMVATTALALVAFFRDPASQLRGGRPRWAWACLGAASLLLVASLVAQFLHSLRGIQVIHRNFYGVLQVKMEVVDPARAECVGHLIHGRTLHGLQYTSEAKRRLPTTYYGPWSGIGIFLSSRPAGVPVRVGVVGLGVGTLAAYGRPGDTYRFYEINPAAIRLARELFLYLADSPARVEIVPGDARLSLEREPPQQFDVLVLDAFSSESIPLHLLTREAMAIYLRHLRPEGVLALHISNVYVDLSPVVAGLAQDAGLEMVSVFSPGRAADGIQAALWALLSRKASSLHTPQIDSVKLPPERRRILWTDDRNSLWEVLK